MIDKPNDMVVDTVIYNKMLDSSIVLFRFIKEKQQNNMLITKEEADWANDFYDYAKELERKFESKNFN